jgi:MoxR-like ATPase
MTNEFNVDFYKGDPNHEPDIQPDPETCHQLGLTEAPNDRGSHPRWYKADPHLRAAVRIAVLLGKPLLLTGVPGTGKTELARSIAYDLGRFYPQQGLPVPLSFHTKSTSTATDLFYSYDAVGHFHKAHFNKENVDVKPYITFQALGLAILLSNNPEVSRDYLPENYQELGQRRSVVLIDEVDKAPRDFPNDILHEIEKLSFSVKEFNSGKREFKVDQNFTPIIIITSNSEKNLPEPFLRRCVYYNIEISIEYLREVLHNRIAPSGNFTEEMLESALQLFYKLSEPLSRRPATGELLQWLRLLQARKIAVFEAGPEVVKETFGVIAKKPSDRQAIDKAFDELSKNSFGDLKAKTDEEVKKKTSDTPTR